MRLLVTGATGYLGQSLLPRLLADGHELALLTRRRGLALSPLWHGDIRFPHCALEDRAALAAFAPQGVVHLAGLLSFEEGRRQAVEAVNLHGTRHLFQLAAELGVQVFHHVSTAFVAGDTPHPFGPSHFRIGQAFRNPYEESKAAAEDVLRHSQGIPHLVIHRPSILVGGGGPEGGGGTLYSYLKTLRFLKQCVLRDRRGHLAPLGARQQGEETVLPLRLAADPATRLDLVPVGWVAERLAASIANLPEEPLVTCHHVAGGGPSLEELRRAFCGELKISGLRLVPRDALADPPRNTLEERLHRATRVYDPYLWQTTRLLGDAVPPPVDPVLLARDYLRQRQKEENLAELALDALAVEDADTYFKRFTEGDFGSSFLAAYPFLQGAIRFTLTGAGAVERILHFHSQTVRLAGPQETRWDCGFTLDSARFLDIVRARRDPRQAFFAGEVTIAGDMELGLKFAFLLSDYLSRIDDHLLSELAP